LARGSLALLATSCMSQPRPTPTPAAPAAPTPHAALGSWGIDLSARDLTVNPGDDFFHYPNGHWLLTPEIPADRTRWGTFDMLADKADRDVREIIEGVAAAGGAPGSNEQKIADFYRSYLDTDGINTKGLAPAQTDLAAIAALRDHEQT